MYFSGTYVVTVYGSWRYSVFGHILVTRDRHAPHDGAGLHRADGVGHRLVAGLLDRPAGRHRHLLDALSASTYSQTVTGTCLTQVSLTIRQVGHRDLLDAFLGDQLAGRDRDLLADRVRDLLADGHRDLLADDLRLVDRAADVLDDRPRAADRRLAPGAGALTRQPLMQTVLPGT